MKNKYIMYALILMGCITLGYYAQTSLLSNVYLLFYFVGLVYVIKHLFHFMVEKYNQTIQIEDFLFKVFLLFIPLNGIIISIYNIFLDTRSIFIAVFLPDVVILFLLTLANKLKPFFHLKRQHPIIFYAFLFWLLGGIGSVIAVGTDFENTTRILVQRVFIPVLFLTNFVYYCKSKEKLHNYISIVLSGAFIYFGYTIYRYLNFFQFPDTHQLIFNRYNFSGKTDVYFFNSNFISGILLLLFVLAAWRFWNNYKAQNNTLDYMFIFVILVNLLMCFSRGALLTLALLVVFIIILIFKNRMKELFTKKLVAGVLVLFSFFIIIIVKLKLLTPFIGHFENLFQADGSGTIRFNMWLHAVELFLNHWFIGYGFGEFGINYANLSRDANTHNLILNIMLDMGIFGLIGFLLLMIYVIMICYTKNLAIFSLGIFVIFSIGLTTGLELDFLSTTWSVNLVFMIISCIIAYSNIVHDNPLEGWG